MNIGSVNRKPDMSPVERAAQPGDREADCGGFDEPWAALHNFQIWRTGPDETNGAWRNDGTGFYGD